MYSIYNHSLSDVLSPPGDGMRFNLLTQVKEREGMEGQAGALNLGRFDAPNSSLSFHSFFLFHLYMVGH